MNEYRGMSVDQLVDLLLSEGDRVTIELVDEIVSRGAAAVPRLRALLLDEEYWYEGQGDRFWVEFHVVAILGMIADPGTLPDLLSMVPHSYFAGNQWISNYWREHLSRFGPAAIDQLSSVIVGMRGLHRDNPDYSDVRSDAAEALMMIAWEHPAERERVPGLLLPLFEDPDEDDRVFLSLIIGSLACLDSRRTRAVVASASRRGMIDRRIAPSPRNLAKALSPRDAAPFFHRHLPDFYRPESIARRARIWKSSDIEAALERENDADPLIATVSPVPPDLDSCYPDRQAPVLASEQRAGRNDPCPCGSGRKYKKCCGAAS